VKGFYVLVFNVWVEEDFSMSSTGHIVESLRAITPFWISSTSALTFKIQMKSLNIVYKMMKNFTDMNFYVEYSIPLQNCETIKQIVTSSWSGH